MTARLAELGRDVAWGVRAASLFVQYTVRRFGRDRCLAAAGALTFTTLLALIPSVVIGFAVLAAFPVFDRVRAQFQGFLAENLPPQLARFVLDHLDRFLASGGEVRTIGVVILVATVLVLLINIEAAFNAIWRVTDKRPLVWRMVAFWAVLTMGPMLFGFGLSVSGSGAPAGPDALPAARPAGGLDLTVLALIAFGTLTVLYTVIPNRPVRLVNAAAGAAVAALFAVALAALSAAVVVRMPALGSVYDAIVDIPLFLVWLFAGWVMVLSGAVVTASLSEWGARREVLGRPHMSPGNRLTVALALLATLNAASRIGAVRRRKELLRSVPLGAFVVEAVLDDLVRARYASRVGRNGWVLSRDLGTTTLHDLYEDLHLGIDADAFRWFPEAPWHAEVRAMIDAFDAAGRARMGQSLRTLFATPPEGPPNRALPARSSVDPGDGAS